MMSSEASWFCWMNFATPSGSSSTFMADCAARSAEMRASRSASASFAESERMESTSAISRLRASAALFAFAALHLTGACRPSFITWNIAPWIAPSRTALPVRSMSKSPFSAICWSVS